MDEFQIRIKLQELKIYLTLVLVRPKQKVKDKS